jgi:carbonic anhydrase
VTTPRPRKKLAVLACMDARINPVKLLELEDGDAHVIRNAGGVVTDDVIRSLALSQHMLGTEEIVLIQHTDCGLQKASDEEITSLLAEHAGQSPPFKPQAFTDVDRNIRESMKALEQSPFLLKKDRIRGYVFEVETRTLREVS